ncbi:MAG: glycosyltransferase family 25 protein, partial [Bacteroidales bacterium]
MINVLLKEGVFVVHALQGYEMHEKRIIELFGKQNIDFEFVIEGDPSNFNDTLLQKYFVEHIHDILNPGTLSCTLNHILAYEKMIAKNLQ